MVAKKKMSHRAELYKKVYSLPQFQIAGITPDCGSECSFVYRLYHTYEKSCT